MTTIFARAAELLDIDRSPPLVIEWRLSAASIHNRHCAANVGTQFQLVGHEPRLPANSQGRKECRLRWARAKACRRDERRETRRTRLLGRTISRRERVAGKNFMTDCCLPVNGHYEATTMKGWRTQARGQAAFLNLTDTLT